MLRISILFYSSLLILIFKNCCNVSPPCKSIFFSFVMEFVLHMHHFCLCKRGNFFLSGETRSEGDPQEIDILSLCSVTYFLDYGLFFSYSPYYSPYCFSPNMDIWSCLLLFDIPSNGKAESALWENTNWIIQLQPRITESQCFTAWFSKTQMIKEWYERIV